MKKPAFLLGLLAALAAVRPLAGQGVAVSPAMVMLKGHAGESTTQTLTLTNSTDRAMAFEMVANDIVVRGGKRVWVAAGALPGSIAATAVFSQKSVVVPPGGLQRVDIHVTIPPRPASRAIVALFKGTTKFTAGQASVTASLGVILTFNLSDKVAMRTAPLVVQPPTSTRNLTVSQMCMNDGSEPIAPKAMLAIVNKSGRLIGRTPISAARLLPGEKQEIRTEYAGELAPGLYRALITYDLGDRTLTSSAEFNVR